MHSKKFIKTSLQEYCNESDEMNIWYHGSDEQISSLKTSQQLKLDYKTENGAWLTSNIYQAKFYGKYVYKFDVSDLKILDKSNMDKNEFVIYFWVNKMKKDKKMILNSMKIEDKFKDFYDTAFKFEVEYMDYDAIKLNGELNGSDNEGYDLWVGYDAVDKIKMVNNA